MAVDAGSDVGIADGSGFNEVHNTSQQLLEFGLGPKKHTQVRLCFRRKFDQKVHITGLGLEIISPSGGPKHLKPMNAVALAYVGDTSEMLRNGRVHVSEFSGGLRRFATFLSQALAPGRVPQRPPAIASARIERQDYFLAKNPPIVSSVWKTGFS